MQGIRSWVYVRDLRRGNGILRHLDVVALDSTTGSFSQLINTSSHGQTFNWAFAGALEVYNMSSAATTRPMVQASIIWCSPTPVFT